SNEGFAFKFSPNRSGGFSATTTALTGGTGTGPTLTLTGQITASTITGTIQPLGISFSSVADPSSGPSSNLSGLYVSSAVSSPGSSTYTIVGTQGEVYALTAAPGVVAAGAGTVTSGGAFTVTPTGAAAITGSVSTSSGQVTGTVSLIGGGSYGFAA